MEIQGKVITIKEIEVLKNDFRKQMIIIETEDKFPKKIAIDFVKDKIELVANIKVGNRINAFINIESKEFNDKFFTNITCWKAELI